MAYTDSEVQLVINKMTKAQYDAFKDLHGGIPPANANELFLVEEANLNGENQRIISVATPVADSDAATKKYVDDAAKNAITALDYTSPTLTGSIVPNSISEVDGKISVSTRVLSAHQITNISSVISGVVNPMIDPFTTSAEVSAIAGQHVAKLTATYSAQAGKYVSSVSQTSGVVSATFADLPAADVYSVSAITGTDKTEYKLMKQANGAGAATAVAETITVPNNDTYEISAATVTGKKTYTLMKKTNGTGTATKVDTVIEVSDNDAYKLSAIGGDTNNVQRYQLLKQANGTGAWTALTDATIEIPKDKVLDGGKVVTYATDLDAVNATGDSSSKAGKYLQLKIANTNTSVYVPVPELVDIYTGSNGTEISVGVADGVISSILKEKVVDAKHLTTALSNEINGKQTAAQVSAIASAYVDPMTTSAEVSAIVGQHIAKLSVAQTSLTGSQVLAGIKETSGVISVSTRTLSAHQITNISSLVSGIVTPMVDPMTTSAEVSTIVEGYNYTRTYVDGVRSDISARHISQEDYAALLKTAEGPLSNVLYIVSSETRSNFGKTLEDVADPVKDTDAATKAYVDSQVNSSKTIIRNWTSV